MPSSGMIGPPSRVSLMAELKALPAASTTVTAVVLRGGGPAAP